MTHPPRLVHPPRPVRPPRLVATDLDGTFLRSDGTVSARSAAVWTALAERGIETVIVTARPPRWLHGLEHVVGPRGIALCGNGAFVYQVATRRVVQTHCFEADVVEAVAADLRAAIPGIAFAAERSSGLFLESGFPDRRDGDEGTVVGDLARLAEEPVGKLLALAPGLPTAELLDRVRTVVGDRGHLADSGAHGLAEVNAVGVTKGAALAAWCADLAIEAPDVWAFGDMPGDLPMLRWAGRGYAVANAHPDVLAAASHRCGSNDEDGVVGILDIFVNGFSLDH